MSGKKLFITGGTGFIGGSVLAGIVKTFPDLEITALQRKPTEEFKARYPNVKIVIGDFNAADVIEKASGDAEIIIHAGDSDHAPSVNAILSGLKKKTTPSFLLHLSGTGVISDQREQTWEGNLNPKVWDDVKDIQELYDLPKEAWHHVIDNRIIDASDDLIHTAIICPPDIYGQNLGVGFRQTFLVPMFIRYAMLNKAAYYLGKGENIRNVVHISDIVQLFELLIKNAIEGGGKAQWGKEGFYFGVSYDVPWIDAATAISKIGIKQGWLPPNAQAVSWDKEEFVEKLKVSEEEAASYPCDPAELMLYIWGSNSRAESTRAKRLGWVPKGPSFWECLEEDVGVAVEKLKAWA